MKSNAWPLCLLLAGLATAHPVHAGQAAQVKAAHAWIRLLPAGLPAGGYVQLHNDGDQPAVIQGARSPRYAQVMLHESTTAGGMGRMKRVDQLTVPAHGEVRFAPGGYHLMLMQAATPVAAGQSVPVTLDFADGSHLQVDFLARPANALDDGTGSGR